MSKVCSKCNENKDFIHFHKMSYSKDGYQYVCKECNRKRDRIRNVVKKEYLKTKSKENYWRDPKKHIKKIKERQLRQKTPYYSIYFLPEYNYVGMTNWLENRISVHKSQDNRKINIVKVLGKVNSKKDCAIIESLFHKSGFEGGDSKNQNLSNQAKDTHLSTFSNMYNKITNAPSGQKL